MTISPAGPQLENCRTTGQRDHVDALKEEGTFTVIAFVRHRNMSANVDQQI